MIVRRGEMRASKAMQHRVENSLNIEILWHSEIADIVGSDTVEGVIVKNNLTGKIRMLDVAGLFVAIGHKPNTDIFKEQLDMDESGYVKTIPGTSKTNIAGAFAVGDCADKVYRQAVTAAGSGCIGALDAERYLALAGIQ